MVLIGLLLDCYVLILRLRTEPEEAAGRGLSVVSLICYAVAVTRPRSVLFAAGDSVFPRVILVLLLVGYHVLCVFFIPFWHNRGDSAWRIPSTQTPERLREIHEPIAEILREMEQLLRRVHWHGHADLLVDVMDEIERDPYAIRKRLVSLDFWGAAGSFRDIVIYDGDKPSVENVPLCELLIKLLRELGRSGYAGASFVRREISTLASSRDYYASHT